MKRRAAQGSERGGILVNLVILLFLAVLCAVVYFARHPIMRFLAEEWVVDEPVAHADALVVLGDDNFYADRATHAAELWRQGVAPIIVVSGRRLRPDAGLSELMEHDLIERGVPKVKIVRLTHDADNTIEEARVVGKLAQERHWKTMVIVTSNYHTRRTRYIYEKLTPTGITVTVASAHDGEFDPEHWWEKRISIKDFTREIAGMAEAMWELRNANKNEASSVSGKTNRRVKLCTIWSQGVRKSKYVPFTSDKCRNIMKILSRADGALATTCDSEMRIVL